MSLTRNVMKKYRSAASQVEAACRSRTAKLAAMGGALGLAHELSFAVGTSVIPAASVTKFEEDGTATMTAIGGALIAVAVVAVLFKWGKAAIFG